MVLRQKRGSCRLLREDGDKNKTPAVDKRPIQTSTSGENEGVSFNAESRESEEWPQFRGPFRDGTVRWLPGKLPETAEFDWSVALPSEGLGGLAVAQGCVIVSGRDARDQKDLWTCLEADTGDLRWSLTYPAPGRLDYGNSPRATPLISGERAWLLGSVRSSALRSIEQTV